MKKKSKTTRQAPCALWQDGQSTLAGLNYLMDPGHIKPLLTQMLEGSCIEEKKAVLRYQLVAVCKER